MTKLSTWMKAAAVGDNWLAARVGVSRSQASRIRRGKSVPSLEAAVTIERVTKGRVKPSDLLVEAPPMASANDPLPHSEAA